MFTKLLTVLSVLHETDVHDHRWAARRGHYGAGHVGEVQSSRVQNP